MVVSHEVSGVSYPVGRDGHVSLQHEPHLQRRNDQIALDKVVGLDAVLQKDVVALHVLAHIILHS